VKSAGIKVGLFALLFGGIASAEELYVCKFKEVKANGGWMPAEVYIGFKSEVDEVVVFDPLIKYFVGEPIPGKISVDNPKRITFTWFIDGTVDRAKQFAKMEYRLTYLKGTKSASMTGQALGFLGPYASQGACAIQKK